MRIGAISAYNYQPYVYNMNTVSSSSINKLSKISDDVLDKKVDYSELTDESKNINPLKKGQTLDFQSMLEMQMQRGQNNAARIMKPAEDTRTEEEETTQSSNANVTQFTQASPRVQETVSSVSEENTADVNSDNSNGSNISYQMQQALNAYGMFMTA